jgi:hypothetical protein
MQQKWRTTTNSQTTRTDLSPKFDVIGQNHPVLQFYSNSAVCGEVSQDVQEELPFSITI